MKQKTILQIQNEFCTLSSSLNLGFFVGRETTEVGIEYKKESRNAG